MKAKHFFDAIIFFVFACSFSAHANNYWIKSYGGTAYDEARAVQPTSDGGFILAGWGDSFSGNGADPWVLKLDEEGQVEWQRAFVGAGRDNAQSVKQTVDGGYVVVGYTNSFSPYHESSGFIIRLDTLGNVLWQRTYPGAEYVNNYFHDIVIDPDDGHFVVVGKAGSDILVMKVSSTDGEIIWQKLYGKAPAGSYSHDPIDDEAYSIKHTSDGGYIVSGDTSFFGCGARWMRHFWILKLDGEGNLSWNQEIGSTRHCDESIAYGVAQLTDGSFVAVGKVLTFDGDYVNVRGAYLVNLAEDGTPLWSKFLESGGSGAAYGVEATDDGGFIVTGATAYSTNVASYLWLTKFDAAGEVQWREVYGNGAHSAFGYAVKQLPSNAFVVAGSSPHTHTNFWLLKVNGSGEIPTCPLAQDMDTAWRPAMHVTAVDELRVWAHAVHAGQAHFQATDTDIQALEQCYADVEINDPPVMDSFAVEPTSGTAPLDVAVICHAHDPDGNIASYEFNPGDGSDPLTSEDGALSHTYAVAGSYDATCTAVDDEGAETTSEPVTVNVAAHQNQRPMIDAFSVSPTSGEAPLAVTVVCQASDSDGTVVGYEFNPADGSEPMTSGGGTFSQSYTYENPGSYPTTCTAYDDQGAHIVSEPVMVNVAAHHPVWQDVTGSIGVSRSRTLLDRINRSFFVLLDLTNGSGAELAGPVRMVLQNATLPLKESAPGLDPDGYTAAGDPYFLLVPAGDTWAAAGATLEDVRLDFLLQRKRLGFDLMFEQLQ